MTPFVLIIFVIITWGLSGYALHGIENRGTFGDMFGAINSLFSGLAFAGVVYAILLQQKEIKLQKEELTLTREELKKTADAAEKQANFMEAQRKRDDLYRLIAKLADRINNNYNSNFLESGVSLHRILKGSDNININEELRMLYDSNNQSDSSDAIFVKYLETDLIRLSALIKAYESDSGRENEYNPISDFYKHEFGDLVSRLFQYGILKSSELGFYRQNSK